MKNDILNFLAGINTKDAKAWEKLYDDYYIPLCHYAVKILNDHDQAVNLVQAAIVRLWEKPLYFEHIAEFNVYLYRAVHNNCLKEIRDRIRESEYLQEWETFEEKHFSETLPEVVFEEVIRKLRLLIDRMPPKRQKVILLSMKDMTNENIGKELGISVNTVKKHKKEAYAMIKEEIRSDLFLLFFFGNKF